MIKISGTAEGFTKVSGKVFKQDYFKSESSISMN